MGVQQELAWAVAWCSRCATPTLQYGASATAAYVVWCAHGRWLVSCCVTNGTSVIGDAGRRARVAWSCVRAAPQLLSGQRWHPYGQRTARVDGASTGPQSRRRHGFWRSQLSGQLGTAAGGTRVQSVHVALHSELNPSTKEAGHSQFRERYFDLRISLPCAPYAQARCNGSTAARAVAALRSHTQPAAPRYPTQ